MSGKLGFLDLPASVRRKIYEYAGMTGKTVDLNWPRTRIWLDYQNPDEEDEFTVSCWHDADCGIIRREDYQTLTQYWEEDEDCKIQPLDCDAFNKCEGEDCFNSDSSFAIMFTCYTIFVELLKTTYGRNRFVLDRGGPGGFEPLARLRGYSLRALTHLTIRLDGEPPERVNLSHHWTRTSELSPMKHYSRYGKQAYKQWTDLIARLKESSLVPRRLNLFLLAKVPNVKEAELVLRPLESLPTLKSCGIWLNSKPIPELTALIKRTVESLITPDPEDEDEEKVIPFRYLDLPLELRLRILEFSDLLTSADLEWRPAISSLGPIPDAHCSCYDELGYSYDGSVHLEDCHTVYMQHPEKRLTGLDTEYQPSHFYHCCCCDVEKGSRLRCRLKNDPYMCIFACPNHSSFTAPKPDGWKPFCHALFLVSHQVRQDVIPVFFRKHRFVLTPLDALPLRHLNPRSLRFQPDYTIPMPRTGLSFFFSSMPKEALRHIRYLEWLCPPSKIYQSAAKSAYLDHLDTVELMIQAMTLPNLTLVVNMRHVHANRGGDNNFNWSSRVPGDDALYRSILGPLCLLGENGLKDCWIYLRNIWKPRPAFGSARWHQKYNRDKDEMRWEKRVMGNENYNAFERGKPWMERVERAVEENPRNVGTYADYREEYPYFY